FGLSTRRESEDALLACRASTFDSLCVLLTTGNLKSSLSQKCLEILVATESTSTAASNGTAPFSSIVNGFISRYTMLELINKSKRDLMVLDSSLPIFGKSC